MACAVGPKKLELRAAAVGHKWITFLPSGFRRVKEERSDWATIPRLAV
jgi:hypothetical protein